MTKRSLLIIAAAAFLCSCSAGKPDDIAVTSPSAETSAETSSVSETTVTETETSPEISDITEESGTSPETEATTEAISETYTSTSAGDANEFEMTDEVRSLIEFMEEHTGGYEFHEVVPKFFGDFDGDGVSELIAYIDDPDSLCGFNIWCMNTADYLSLEMLPLPISNYTPVEYSDPEIVFSGDLAFLKIEGLFVSDSISFYYRISDSRFSPCTIDSFALQGLRPDKNGDFTACHSTYDMNSDGTGHTWKPYWLYYSPDENTFYMYKGTDISEEKLLEYDGANKVLEKARSENMTVSEIILRENGIININLTTEPDGEYYHNKFYILEVRGNSVYDVTPEYNDGYYLKG